MRRLISFSLFVVHRTLKMGKDNESKGVLVFRVRTYVRGVKLSNGRGLSHHEAKENAARVTLGYLESNLDGLKSTLLLMN